MDAFLLFVHIAVSLLLIIVVLLQSGKSADLAGAFGGAGSQSTFGPRGAATLLSKVTTTLAILFMITSLLLWLRADMKTGSRSVMTEAETKQEQKVDQKAVEPKKEQTEKKGLTNNKQGGHKEQTDKGVWPTKRG